ncbi:hypothetical protein F9L06_08090 [Brucella anthropi]|uniref:Uncharacterized protein n=1 Tax=Brucella anthropi TaxID=529 RepID=A0A6I0DQ34_BRUAN|nr:hypothetical protein [Brucella anthropi]KAB2801629.1 hypothetical protein F9L06_08090 [Brucella anthropi]
MQTEDIPAWLLERKAEAEKAPVQAPDGTWAVWPFPASCFPDKVDLIYEIPSQELAIKIRQAILDAYGEGYGDGCLNALGDDL